MTGSISLDFEDGSHEVDSMAFEDGPSNQLEVDDFDLNQPEPTRCCGCVCIALARRWQKGLRKADLADLERRQKALEWSDVFDADSGSAATMQTAGSERDWDGASIGSITSTISSTASGPPVLPIEWSVELAPAKPTQLH